MPSKDSLESGRASSATANPGTARPFERKAALYSVGIAVLALLIFAFRENSASTSISRLGGVLSISAVMLLVATLLALPGQDESFRPKWCVLNYLVILGGLGFLPFASTWASDQSIGLSPSLIPWLIFFICLVAPLAVPNQMAYGIGSIIPKSILMSAVMHYTDNTDWGIFSANTLVSPSTALAGMAIFTLMSSTLSLAIKSKTPTWLMFLLGVFIPLPCMFKIEVPLVVFHVL